MSCVESRPRGRLLSSSRATLLDAPRWSSVGTKRMAVRPRTPSTLLVSRSTHQGFCIFMTQVLEFFWKLGCLTTVRGLVTIFAHDCTSTFSNRSSHASIRRPTRDRHRKHISLHFLLNRKLDRICANSILRIQLVRVPPKALFTIQTKIY